jgi:hypothetical protein
MQCSTLTRMALSWELNFSCCSVNSIPFVFLKGVQTVSLGTCCPMPVSGLQTVIKLIGQQLSGQKVKRLFYMFQNSLATLSH